jgi:hypothetical protein
MSPNRQDSEPIASTNQAPRCQHVRMNGARCGASALHGQPLCDFHQRVSELTVMTENAEARALRFILKQVTGYLEGQPPDYERCRLLFDALELGRANLDNIAAEEPDHTRPSGAQRNRQARARGKSGEQRREKQGRKVWIN